MDRPYELQVLKDTYRLSITWLQSAWSVVGTFRVGVGPQKRHSVVEGFHLTLTGYFYIFYDLLQFTIGLRYPLLHEAECGYKSDGGAVLFFSD